MLTFCSIRAASQWARSKEMDKIKKHPTTATKSAFQLKKGKKKRKKEKRSDKITWTGEKLKKETFVLQLLIFSPFEGRSVAVTLVRRRRLGVAAVRQSERLLSSPGNVKPCNLWREMTYGTISPSRQMIASLSLARMNVASSSRAAARRAAFPPSRGCAASAETSRLPLLGMTERAWWRR